MLNISLIDLLIIAGISFVLAISLTIYLMKKLVPLLDEEDEDD